MSVQTKKTKKLFRGVAAGTVFLLFQCVSVFGQVNLDRYQADKVYEKGDHYHAMQMYKELLDGNPNDPELNYNAGNTLYKMNLHEEALKFYQRALANTSDDKLRLDIEYNMANALFKSGKVQESIDGYKQVLRRKPDDQDARFNLEYAMKRLEKEKPPPQKGADKQQSERDPNKDKSDDRNKDNKDNKEKSDKSERDDRNQDQSRKPNSGQSQVLSKKDAERILDALKHQEKEYQKKKVKEKAQTDSRSEKDW